MDDKSKASGDKAGNPQPPVEDQLLSKKAESYLREGGKIEDYPTEEDELDAKEDKSADGQAAGGV